jgi:hypothetical protein
MEPEVSLPCSQSQSLDWIESTNSHLITWTSILILSSPLGLGSQVIFSLQVSRLEAYLMLVVLIILTICFEMYKLWSCPFCNFLHSFVTSSILGPNIPLSILFSITLHFCSSLRVRDRVWNSYEQVKLSFCVFLCYVSPCHHGMADCGWRGRPTDMEGSCEYIE